MGLFDTVFTSCGVCGNRLEFQSKGGACCMKEYNLYFAPPEVLGGIHGDVEICSKCGAKYQVIVQTIARTIFMGYDEKDKGDIK